MRVQLKELLHNMFVLGYKTAKDRELTSVEEIEVETCWEIFYKELNRK
jgi:hypothetical protein